MGSPLHAVIETEIYLRTAERLMSEDERAAVVNFFASHPQAGDVIPGAGGLRKVRVPLAGRGKRGDRGVYLLLAYAKSEQANPTPEQARALARLVETLF